jgi:excinuclease ABC subunit A
VAVKKKVSLPVYAEKDAIWIKGANMHNLKNIEVVLPKYTMIAVTGLSGSGKSSLIMDTLYAEGQRRYVESLSAYARQFLSRMKKPDVDFIKGLCPAIAVEQKVVSGNTRSTVGSMTELFDLLRVLYARIGKTFSPISGDEVKRDRVADVVDFVSKQKDGSKILILSPLNLHYSDRSLGQQLDMLIQKGYSRVLMDDEMSQIDEVIASLGKRDLNKKLAAWQDRMFVLIDRVVMKSADPENEKRIADSIQTAMAESEGGCVIKILEGEMRFFSARFELDGMTFPELNPQLFNYNNPYGACPSCEGYGMTIGIDERKVIPDENKSLIDGAIACWNGEKSKVYLKKLLLQASTHGIPIHKPYKQLDKKQKDLVWNGASTFKGIYDYFDELESQSYKIQNRVLLARFRGRTTCRTCQGQRLRLETTYVKIGDHHIGELIDLPLKDLQEHFNHLKLTDYEKEVAKRLLYEVNTRLRIMNRIGLGYLTLNRTANSLSGGETQRINLTRLLGSNLSDSLYILDEPSIGLHPKDTEAMVEVLHELRDVGNTVIVVEHEEEVIRKTDYILDIGPGAGVHGGEVLYMGDYKSFIKAGKTLTSKYLTGKMSVTREKTGRPVNNKLMIKGASHHNLQDIDVTIPLNRLSVVTGVSGSGKSSLLRGIIYPEVRRKLGLNTKRLPGAFKEMQGDFGMLSDVEYVSQKPIGRSSRSNPVTYIKAYDAIRQLFMKQHLAKVRGYKPKHFSFNVDGGRCDNCKGEGSITVEMQFLADINLTCEVCNGKRFKDEILEVRINGKNIHDVLSLSVAESMEFFSDFPELLTSLQPLMDVGLEYIQLGQPSSTLSGGEAQRLKLAYFLSKERHREHILFLFDEPTTGLHFHDVNKLLGALDMLIARGNTVVVIEHNLDVIANADWVIDLGPGGGDEGGHLVFEGPVNELIKNKKSHTAAYLRLRQ